MNILAILIAALACFVLGFLFHGPLFGKLWMKLANVTPTGNEKLSDMTGQMVWNYVVNVLMAFVLAGALWIAASSPLIGGLTWYKGAIIGAWLWLGFIAPSSSIEVIWMKRSFKLWLFEAVASLICTGVMGIILAVWR